MSSDDNIKKLNKELSELLEKEINNRKSILGISISTHGGTHLVSKLKKDITMTNSEISAASSSLVFISSKMLRDSLFAIQISAFVETSDLIKEEVFVAIKRAIPNALVIAIITKDGLPIKVQATMPEPMLSAMTSAIYNLAGILLEEGLEFSIIGGENGSIIIHELDESRILAIAVPEADERKLGSYIAKIKSIIK